ICEIIEKCKQYDPSFQTYLKKFQLFHILKSRTSAIENVGFLEFILSNLNIKNLLYSNEISENLNGKFRLLAQINEIVNITSELESDKDFIQLILLYIEQVNTKEHLYDFINNSRFLYQHECYSLFCE
ncbi:MAG: hypothetical protein MHPSP_001359, partial [Paramarteilia canceri]